MRGFAFMFSGQRDKFRDYIDTHPAHLCPVNSANLEEKHVSGNIFANLVATSTELLQKV